MQKGIIEQAMQLGLTAFLLLTATLDTARGASGFAPVTTELMQLAHNQPSLRVDLGVGIWGSALPMDYNGDKRMDLVLVSRGKPHEGTWYFENTGTADEQTRLPLFKPGILIGPSAKSAAISYVTGRPIITSTASVPSGQTYDFRGLVHPDFLRAQFSAPLDLGVPKSIHTEPGEIWQNRWTMVDYDGDGVDDVTVGLDFWGDYGWEAAFDAEGRWTRGPLHGYVYLLRNTGTTTGSVYAPPVKIEAAGWPVDTFGMPTPCWGDFDGDSDLDLLCGEFLNSFTYFENIGTRQQPRYAAGRKLMTAGVPLLMDGCMITPTAVDFDGDGDLDVICIQEDGLVAFIEHTGQMAGGVPQFLPPRYFRQLAAGVKFGSLVTPCTFDWDGDGDDDLIAGNSSGYVAFIENLGGEPVCWAPPRLLSADGRIIHEQAGENGSVQGPAEAKWGYANPSVADWNGDGLPDLITNGIWGKIRWYRNVGTRTSPRLATAQAIEVAAGTISPKPAWNWWSPAGRELVTQWRTTPQAVDWDGDGLTDLVMLDHEGYLALFRRRREAAGSLELGLAERIFRGETTGNYDRNGRPTDDHPGLLRLNAESAGGSGRRNFCIVDWDGDGQRDLLVNSVPNVNFLRGRGRNSEGQWIFRDEGPVTPQVLAGHATKPTTLDLNADGLPDLLIGTEDGFLYQLLNPRTVR